MAGRCAAIRDCGATKLAGFLRMMYLERLPVASVHSSLPPSLTRAFKNGTAFKNAMDYQLRKLGAEPNDENIDALAANIVLAYGRAPAGGEGAHRSEECSAVRPRTTGMTIAPIPLHRIDVSTHRSVASIQHSL